MGECHFEYSQYLKNAMPASKKLAYQENFASYYVCFLWRGTFKNVITPHLQWSGLCWLIPSNCTFCNMYRPGYRSIDTRELCVHDFGIQETAFLGLLVRNRFKIRLREWTLAFLSHCELKLFACLSCTMFKRLNLWVILFLEAGRSTGGEGEGTMVFL